ncbi:MAG: aa3-type cytochrome c oxidase subunit IV [Caulobacteraceae bacterium]|jgi:hypothetical protein|nr:aa3-type cytochrome c oxidase subunit IV [Caulobacteraceae bacterium]MDX5392252.1 aa3-type cytochrome c oxidase subunit IV [Caulobacteraceae bacterium]
MGEQSSDYHRGEMDIQEQVATFDLFMALTKWGSLATTCVILFFSVLFATPAGFMAAAISTVVVAVIGVLVLRGKPADSH